MTPAQTQTSAVAYAVAIGRPNNRVTFNSLYETREALFTAFRHTELYRIRARGAAWSRCQSGILGRA